MKYLTLKNIAAIFLSLQLFVVLNGCNTGTSANQQSPQNIYANFQVIDQEGLYPAINEETLFTNLSFNGYNTYSLASSSFYPNPVIKLGKNDYIKANINNTGQVMLNLTQSVAMYEISYMYLNPNPPNLPNRGIYDFSLFYNGVLYNEQYTMPSIYSLTGVNSCMVSGNNTVTCNIGTTTKSTSFANASKLYVLSDVKSNCVSNSVVVTSNSDTASFSCNINPAKTYTLQLNLTQTINDTTDGYMHLQGQYYFISSLINANFM